MLGTKPEKMVLAELVKRRVPFHFQYAASNIAPHLDYRLDFYIPSTKMDLEINGEYWHTTPGAIDRDAFRYATLEMLGVKVVVLWENDILTRLFALLEEVPELANPPVTGPPLHMENDIDDLKAVRRINAVRRTRTTGVEQRRVRRRRVRASREGRYSGG
ncbi:MAG: DUF559 domain-containing protein [Anaerosomatales bacterium]|nr:DUF559 domain-containing protein [Anaerosomatales bacterium]